jgi:hypothetical protein
MNRFIVSIMSGAILAMASNSFAAGAFLGPSRDANGNVVPTPKGEECVEPTADMRANHMKYLLHKRDRTMYDGIRTKQHSLVECIDCHATPNEEGTIVRVFDESGEHFCATCHRVAAVKLDCFECHADRPVSAFGALLESDPVKAMQAHGGLEHLLGLNDIKPHVARSRNQVLPQ